MPNSFFAARRSAHSALLRRARLLRCAALRPTAAAKEQRDEKKLWETAVRMPCLASPPQGSVTLSQASVKQNSPLVVELGSRNASGTGSGASDSGSYLRVELGVVTPRIKQALPPGAPPQHCCDAAAVAKALRPPSFSAAAHLGFLCMWWSPPPPVCFDAPARQQARAMHPADPADILPVFRPHAPQGISSGRRSSGRAPSSALPAASSSPSAPSPAAPTTSRPRNPDPDRKNIP